MNAGPPEESTPEVPSTPAADELELPAPEPAAVTPAEEPEQPAPEPAVLPAEAPIYEQPAPYAYAPPPGGTVPAPKPPRSMAPLIAIIVVAILVVVAVVAYAGVGYAYAQGRLNSSRNTYNTVVDHENKYTDTINLLGSKITATNLTTASTADLTADQGLIAQLISASQAAGPGVDSDDAALAKADSDLKQNQWLTAISKSDLDKMSTRIGHMRKALADAKIITADYVQIGTFYQAFITVAQDFDALGSVSQSDFAGFIAALDKLKNDTTKAISLDKAPGAPAQLDTFLKTMQAFSTDLANLINAAANNDSDGVNAAEAAAKADANKLDSTDFNSAGSAIDSFYKPLIDDYNSEVDKANNT